MLTCIQLFLLLAPPAGTNFFQQGGGGDRLQDVTVDHAMAAGIIRTTVQQAEKGFEAVKAEPAF